MKHFVHRGGLCVLVFACSPEDNGGSGSGGATAQSAGTGGASSVVGSGGSEVGGAMVEPIPPRDCKASAQSPTFTVSGTSCGMTVQYAAPEGTRILISHAPFVENVNAFTVADTNVFTGSLSHDFLKTHDLSFHVNTRESMDFAVAAGTFTVNGGGMDVCGLGTIYFTPDTPVNIAFESITEADTRSGRVRVRFSNLSVNGASPQFGATEVFACSSGGELTAVFDGNYERVQ